MSRLILVILSLATLSSAQMPTFYREMYGVVWIVKKVDQTAGAWHKLGLTAIQDRGDLALHGRYRGKKQTLRVREVTGRLGSLNVMMLEPLEGANAFTDFLTKHGDGIFSVVYAAPDRQAIDGELTRARALQIDILQTIEEREDESYTFLDTGTQGKFSIGLVTANRTSEPGERQAGVSHIGPVIRESAPVFAFWAKFGFPALRLEHATPRDDSRYRDKPLLLSFDVAFQKYCQPAIEWIVPPQEPENIYADYLKLHGEGIQHVGMPVSDLTKAIASYKDIGYSVWQAGAWGDLPKKGSGRYVYMDTDKIGGVSVELIQAFQ